MKKYLLFVPFLFFFLFPLAQDNHSLYFNGSASANCGTGAGLNITGTSITVEAWIFPTVFASNYWEGSIVAKDMTLVTGYTLRCGGAGRLSFVFAVAGSSWVEAVSGNNALNTNIWQHVAAVYNGITVKLYVNGVEIVSVNENRSIVGDAGSAAMIGGSPGAWAPARNFTGQIDEARIWNVARTEAEIKAGMFKMLSSGTGLVAAYQMTDGAGTSLTDNSGNAHTATLSAGVSWKASAALESQGYALDFDGVDDYVALTNGNVLGNTYTEELWYYPYTNSLVYKNLLGSNSTAGQQRPPCIYQYGLQIHYGHGNGTTWYSDQTTDDVLTLNAWNHIALSFNGTLLSLYVNGRLVQTSTAASGITPIANSVNQIGAMDNYANGRIDEVRLWSTTRTPAQIRDNMMRTLRGNEAGLVAYYRMDERNGNTVYDLGSNARNGTLTNMDAATDRVFTPAFTTWSGNTNNSWTESTNWSTGIPSAALPAGIYKYTLGSEATISGMPTVSHLLLAANASPVLSSAITVNGNLLLEKNILLNGQTITLGGNAMLVEENGRCYGTTGTITTTRNLSNITALDIGGLGAVITTAANMGNTTVTRNHGPLVNGILRNYNISPTNNAGLNASLVFNYSEAELNGITEAELLLFRSTNGGASWTQQNSSTVNTAANSISLTGISAFSLWTGGKSGTVLPLQWLSFTAAKSGSNIILDWSTFNEYLTKEFYIQHSKDGIVWDIIAVTSTSPNGRYSFVHYNPGTGLHFYRIQQRDQNNASKYSDVCRIIIPKSGTDQSIFPNPSTNGYVYFQMEEKGMVKFFDQTGRCVKNILLDKGLQTINTSAIPAGVYRVVKDKRKSEVLIILK
jgi:hypothetical protein